MKQGKAKGEVEAATPRLATEVREMLKREAYHYCADCHSHCRQTIFAVEALKELENEFKVIDGKRVADSCGSHGPNIAVFYVGGECPPCAALALAERAGEQK
jgi:hypothetical protein